MLIDRESALITAERVDEELGERGEELAMESMDCVIEILRSTGLSVCLDVNAVEYVSSSPPTSRDRRGIGRGIALSAVKDD